MTNDPLLRRLQTTAQDPLQGIEELGLPREPPPYRTRAQNTHPWPDEWYLANELPELFPVTPAPDVRSQLSPEPRALGWLRPWELRLWQQLLLRLAGFEVHSTCLTFRGKPLVTAVLRGNG